MFKALVFKSKKAVHSCGGVAIITKIKTIKESWLIFFMSHDPVSKGNKIIHTEIASAIIFTLSILQKGLYCILRETGRQYINANGSFTAAAAARMFPA